MEPEVGKCYDSIIRSESLHSTYEGTTGQLVGAVTVSRASGTSSQLSLNGGKVGLRRVDVISLLLVFRNYELFDFLIIFEVDRVVCFIVTPAPDCSTPGVPSISHHFNLEVQRAVKSYTNLPLISALASYLVCAETRHGDALDPVRRVDSPQHPRAFGAHKRADGGVDVGGATLFAVETLFVGSLVG